MRSTSTVCRLRVGCGLTIIRYSNWIPRSLNDPLLTIAIPTYNYGAYIGEALDSVLSQSFEDFEVVIVDDASTDETERVCRRFVDSDARVRYLRNRMNLGMVENWNHSVSLARGRYLKLLLADDKLWSPDALGLQVGILEADPRISLVTSSRAIIDGGSELREVLDPLGPVDCRLGIRHIERQMLLRVGRGMNYIGEPSAVMIRTGNCEGGFSVRYRQLVDFEMWLRQLGHGDLYCFAKPLCAFRRHAAQQSAINGSHALGELEELELARAHFGRRRAGAAWCAAIECVAYRFWINSPNPRLNDEARALQSSIPGWRRGLVACVLRLRRIHENLSRLLGGRSKRVVRWKERVSRLLHRGPDRETG